MADDIDARLAALDFDLALPCAGWACEGSHGADWYLVFNCGCVLALCNTVKRITLRDGPFGAALERSHPRRCGGDGRWVRVVRMEPVIKGNWDI